MATFSRRIYIFMRSVAVSCSASLTSDQLHVGLVWSERTASKWNVISISSTDEVAEMFSVLRMPTRSVCSFGVGCLFAKKGKAELRSKVDTEGRNHTDLNKCSISRARSRSPSNHLVLCFICNRRRPWPSFSLASRPLWPPNPSIQRSPWQDSNPRTKAKIGTTEPLTTVSYLGTHFSTIHNCMAAIKWERVMELVQTFFGVFVSRVNDPSRRLMWNIPVRRVTYL